MGDIWEKRKSPEWFLGYWSQPLGCAMWCSEEHGGRADVEQNIEILLWPRRLELPMRHPGRACYRGLGIRIWGSGERSGLGLLIWNHFQVDGAASYDLITLPVGRISMEKRRKLKAEPWDLPTFRDWRGRGEPEGCDRAWKQVKEVFQERRSDPWRSEFRVQIWAIKSPVVPFGGERRVWRQRYELCLCRAEL